MQSHDPLRDLPDVRHHAKLHERRSHVDDPEQELNLVLRIRIPQVAVSLDPDLHPLNLVAAHLLVLKRTVRSPEREPDHGRHVLDHVVHGHLVNEVHALLEGIYLHRLEAVVLALHGLDLVLGRVASALSAIQGGLQRAEQVLAVALEGVGLADNLGATAW